MNIQYPWLRRVSPNVHSERFPNSGAVFFELIALERVRERFYFCDVLERFAGFRWLLRLVRLLVPKSYRVAK
jgi:hypothetical protein